jgi:hypothetical protein
LQTIFNLKKKSAFFKKNKITANWRYGEKGRRRVKDEQRRDGEVTEMLFGDGEDENWKNILPNLNGSLLSFPRVTNLFK